MDTYKGQKICAVDTYITYHARGQPRQPEDANWTLYVKISPYANYCHLERPDQPTSSIEKREKEKKNFVMERKRERKNY